MLGTRTAWELARDLTGSTSTEALLPIGTLSTSTWTAIKDRTATLNLITCGSCNRRRRHHRRRFVNRTRSGLRHHHTARLLTGRSRSLTWSVRANQRNSRCKHHGRSGGGMSGRFDCRSRWSLDLGRDFRSFYRHVCGGWLNNRCFGNRGHGRFLLFLRRSFFHRNIFGYSFLRRNFRDRGSFFGRNFHNRRLRRSGNFRSLHFRHGRSRRRNSRSSLNRGLLLLRSFRNRSFGRNRSHMRLHNHSRRNHRNRARWMAGNSRRRGNNRNRFCCGNRRRSNDLRSLTRQRNNSARLRTNGGSCRRRRRHRNHRLRRAHNTCGRRSRGYRTSRSLMLPRFLFLFGQNGLQHVARFGNVREINLGHDSLRVPRTLLTSASRSGDALKVRANLFGLVLFQGTGMRFTACQTEFCQYVKNALALDFHLAREIVNTNLTHPPLFKKCHAKPVRCS